MFAAYGLYTHIRANEIRSRLLVGGLFVLVLAFAVGLDLAVRGWNRSLPRGAPADLAGYLAAARADLIWLAPLAVGAAFLWLFAAYHGHQALIDRTVGAVGVTPSEAPRLHGLMETLCISRGMAVPALRIVEDPALNAYATGLNPRQYAVSVTTGLLASLDDRELAAVLAHELTHIRNDDVRTMMIATVIAGVFAFLAECVFRGRDSLGGRGDRDRGGAILAVIAGAVLIAAVWVLAQLIRFSLSRSREYVADAGAVELTKDPDALIAALLKIAGRGDLARAPSGLMELCVDNPRSGWFDLFATHPSIDDRVAALTRYAGGRLPPWM